jgi:cytoskeletal protein RodZ
VPGENNHISFTAADIRKYHEGKLTPGEMHELEKAALEDPFLADALEGFAVDGVQLPGDTDELKKRLEERVADNKVIPLRLPKPFSWLRAAAMIVAVVGAGLLVYQFGFNQQKEANIAQTTAQEKVLQDTVASVTPLNHDTVSTPAIPGTVQPPAKNAETPVLTFKDTPPAFKVNPAASSTQPVQAAPQAALEGKVPGIAVTDNTAKTITADTTKSFKNDYADIQRNKAAEELEGRLSKKEEISMNALTQSKARRNQSFLQNNVFRGKVLDAQNNPLPFANITNSRDNVGTYSDAQGNFVLTSPDSIMDVQVRSLGFENNNVQLQNNLTSNKVVLNDDRSLTEVVISSKKINSRLREGNMVLEEPEPADGWNNYDTYLANNLNVPENYKNKQSSGGEVELSFEVNQLGEPINIKVVKSLCEVCDKEAIRLLKEGPKWKRKAKKGRRTTVTIPF